MCAGLCPTYWTTFGIAQRNRNGSCPVLCTNENTPQFFEFLTPPPPAPQGPMGTTGGGGTSADIVRTQIIFGVDPCKRCWDIAQKPPKCKNSPLTPIVTKISFASFSARRGPPTPKLPRSRPWSLLYPEPKFHADRTILRWDILNRTKQTNKQTNSKLNITPNATLWRDKKKLNWFLTNIIQVSRNHITDLVTKFLEAFASWTDGNSTPKWLRHSAIISILDDLNSFIKTRLTEKSSDWIVLLGKSQTSRP